MRLAVRLVGHFVDRQRHAVDGDRSLGRDMRRERRGCGDGDRHAVADRLGRYDMSDVVDMAGDDMPAKLVADLQRAFEVEAAPRLPHPGRGARDRLGARIDREPAAGPVAVRVHTLIDDRQTRPRTGDRRAKIDACHIIVRPHEDAPVAARLDPVDRADIGDDAGEHRAILFRPVQAP